MDVQKTNCCIFQLNIPLGSSQKQKGEKKGNIKEIKIKTQKKQKKVYYK